MNEKTDPAPNHLGGLINGIIDVQLMIVQAICSQFEIEPVAMAGVFEKLVNGAAQQGGPPDFVAGRQFAPRAIQETLLGLALPKKPSGRQKPILDLIQGGLAGGENRQSDDGREENDNNPSNEPAEPR